MANLAVKESVYSVPSELIYVDHTFNSRGEDVYVGLQDFALEIKGAGEIFNPLIVRPITDLEVHPGGNFEYALISGFRRYMAGFKVLGFGTLPCILRPGMTPLQAMSLNLKENVQRKDLSFYRIASHLAKMYPESISNSVIAQQENFTTRFVKACREVLKMPVAIQNQAKANLLTPIDIERLSRFDGQAQLEEFEKLVEIKTVKEPPKPSYRRSRRKTEILHKLAQYMSVYDANQSLWSDFGRWCIGEISDQELDLSFENFYHA